MYVVTVCISFTLFSVLRKLQLKMIYLFILIKFMKVTIRSELNTQTLVLPLCVYIYLQFTWSKIPIRPSK